MGSRAGTLVMTMASGVALVLSAAIAALASGPALAQSNAEVSARLEALFGDHEPYQELLLALKAAVAADDREAVAAMIAYPLTTTIAGERVAMTSEKDFLERYGQLVTPAVTAAIVRQSYAALFANWQGVMIGDGVVWFGGTCSDDACAETSVKVIAINARDGG